MNNSVALPAETTASDGSMFGLLKAAEAIQERIEAGLSPLGLSLPKFSVLNELAGAREPDGLQLSELAARLSCVRSNITQLIDRLESDGLVKRAADPSDRRGVRASLTATGRERHASGAEVMQGLRMDFAAKVADSDLAAVDRILAALV